MKNNVNILLFAIGISCALTGAGILFHGYVFNENNTGIAIVMGIIGICLISTSPTGILKKMMK